MPLIPGLGRKRQVDLCEIKPSLVSIASSRLALGTGRPYLKKTRKQKRKAPEQARGRSPVSRAPPWPLLQLLCPGSCLRLVDFPQRWAMDYKPNKPRPTKLVLVSL